MVRVVYSKTVAGRIFLSGILLFLVMASPARPQTADSGRVRLQETEIMGRLSGSVGTYKLLETEIVGTVERPRVSYIVPWRDPEPFLLEETDFRRGFLKEIYTPLDRDLFSREMEIRSR
jgi:hypothetical protein